MRSVVREEFLNLPNMLTLLRIAAIPVVMLLIWKGEPEDCVYAGWTYAMATVTDFWDGWLARRQGLVTVMGKFLDPLADKLIVMAMLVMLVALQRVPGWLVVVILTREMTINGLRSMASSEGLIIDAGQDGKIKTALQMLGVLCLVIHYPSPVTLYGLHEVVVDFNVVGFWVLLGSVFFSITSAIDYFRKFFAALDSKRSDPN
ncbi:MAG: CDP-diacylglycerol--glycerol-3-phosphate 3-phosphatidyltransferase [Alphaproteobacteria bacterium]|nr:CDP-diacylglycerol--glycerol-3-phosphate 3-phosphatidyltransferase [Myxococcales bacterium]MCB9745571.1 CDP-diacylglycerol--glycerol-3-phosphate 3-phosphatidyltransferase [Alphaproteobacteria bacterium]